MFEGLAPVAHPRCPVSGLPRPPQERLDGLVAHEEGGGAGGRAHDGGADAGVNAAETAGLVEAGGGLEAGFEGVDWVEGEVDCGAC